MENSREQKRVAVTISLVSRVKMQYTYQSDGILFADHSRRLFFLAMLKNNVK